MKKPLVFLTSLALFGCAINYYEPFYQYGYGYSEVNVAKNRYVVMFHGGDDQDEMDATQYAIVRAADIGQQIHLGYFRIVNSGENEQAQQIIIRERDTDYGRRGGPYHRGYWGPGGGEVVTTHVERRPIVKLVIQYQNEDCDACLSVNEKLQEAAAEGILKLK